MKERVELVENVPAVLSLRTQCDLLGISRGAYYYEPRPESAENLAILRRLDELHLERPVFGSWRLAAQLRREGWEINRKRLESWIGWIVVDVIYVPLYLYKELYLTALLYGVFLAMAIAGLRAWRASWRDEQAAMEFGPLVGATSK